MNENQRVTVRLIAPTRIAGAMYEAGDEVEVYPHEKRNLIAAGYVKGDPDENYVGAVGGKIDAAPSTDEYFAQHDIGARPDIGEGAV